MDIIEEQTSQELALRESIQRCQHQIRQPYTKKEDIEEIKLHMRELEIQQRQKSEILKVLCKLQKEYQKDKENIRREGQEELTAEATKLLEENEKKEKRLTFVKKESEKLRELHLKEIMEQQEQIEQGVEHWASLVAELEEERQKEREEIEAERQNFVRESVSSMKEKEEYEQKVQSLQNQIKKKEAEWKETCEALKKKEAESIAQARKTRMKDLNSQNSESRVFFENLVSPTHSHGIPTTPTTLTLLDIVNEVPSELPSLVPSPVPSETPSLTGNDGMETPTHPSSTTEMLLLQEQKKYAALFERVHSAVLSSERQAEERIKTLEKYLQTENSRPVTPMAPTDSRITAQDGLLITPARSVFSSCLSNIQNEEDIEKLLEDPEFKSAIDQIETNPTAVVSAARSLSVRLSVPILCERAQRVTTADGGLTLNARSKLQDEIQKFKALLLAKEETLLKECVRVSETLASLPGSSNFDQLLEKVRMNTVQQLSSTIPNTNLSSRMLEQPDGQTNILQRPTNLSGNNFGVPQRIKELETVLAGHAVPRKILNALTVDEPSYIKVQEEILELLAQPAPTQELEEEKRTLEAHNEQLTQEVLKERAHALELQETISGWEKKFSAAEADMEQRILAECKKHNVSWLGKLSAMEREVTDAKALEIRSLQDEALQKEKNLQQEISDFKKIIEHEKTQASETEITQRHFSSQVSETERKEWEEVRSRLIQVSEEHAKERSSLHLQIETLQKEFKEELNKKKQEWQKEKQQQEEIILSIKEALRLAEEREQEVQDSLLPPSINLHPSEMSENVSEIDEKENEQIFYYEKLLADREEELKSLRQQLVERTTLQLEHTRSRDALSRPGTYETFNSGGHSPSSLSPSSPSRAVEPIPENVEYDYSSSFQPSLDTKQLSIFEIEKRNLEDQVRDIVKGQKLDKMNALKCQREWKKRAELLENSRTKLKQKVEGYEIDIQHLKERQEDMEVQESPIREELERQLREEQGRVLGLQQQLKESALKETTNKGYDLENERQPTSRVLVEKENLLSSQQGLQMKLEKEHRRATQNIHEQQQKIMELEEKIISYEQAIEKKKSDAEVDKLKEEELMILRAKVTSLEQEIKERDASPVSRSVNTTVVSNEAALSYNLSNIESFYTTASMNVSTKKINDEWDRAFSVEQRWTEKVEVARLEDEKKKLQEELVHVTQKDSIGATPATLNWDNMKPFGDTNKMTTEEKLNMDAFQSALRATQSRATYSAASTVAKAATPQPTSSRATANIPMSHTQAPHARETAPKDIFSSLFG